MTFAAEATQTVATEYNGWTNRETWTVNLWLTNDDYYYDELCDIIKDFDTLAEQVEELERYVRSIIGDYGATMASDVLTAALSRVDWEKIVAGNQ